jgi:hypothetical protein
MRGDLLQDNGTHKQHRASGLNFIVTAIILWNTRYLERAVAALCRIEGVSDHLLAHLSPLGWECESAPKWNPVAELRTALTH